MVMNRERLGELEASRAVDLIELFSSIQGEGPRVGERHLFVRTVHCDIHCAYCDTPLCHAPRAQYEVETRWGDSTHRETHPNPASADQLRSLVADALKARPHAAVSFTGGEPLLQPWLLTELASTVRAAGVKVLLETDGNLPDVFAAVSDSVDVLSMDWKLPSATREAPRTAEHHRMLQFAVDRGIERYVKAVFVEETTPGELEPLITTLSEVDPSALVVLQPCTPFRSVKRAPSMDRALALHDFVAQRLKHVRLLPQVHKMLDVP